ncbi:septum formation protein Maf [candidate division KSB3 bacterium]|nr:septum formation protein Maf [candidate division KSB3 bacterium]
MTQSSQESGKHRFPPLILASGSPRRRELLARAGYAFTVIPPTLDEPNHLPAGLPPAQYAESLAYYKARNISDAHPDARVLGADTIVVDAQRRILGKAETPDEARSMLHILSHHPHEVITGVALVGPGTRRIITADMTRVFMHPMSEQEIEDYIASGEWEGKAGAYAIQESADRYVERLEGSFSNVVGLPMELIDKLPQTP